MHVWLQQMRSISFQTFKNQISQKTNPEILTSVGSPKEVLVDDPDEMFQLADLLEGVSVDCAELSSETHTPGRNHMIVTYKTSQQ